MTNSIASRDILKKNIATGFALFAMFFGAGNMVFPLFLGANSGHYIYLVAISFIIVGVGTPMLGLIATGLYHGDYWAFFGRLGKVPAYFLITFLMLIIGPLSAAPRTEVITYQSISPFLPTPLAHPLIFSAIFCIITFLCAYRETKVIDIIGCRITPVKLTCFIILILMAIVSYQPFTTQDHKPLLQILQQSVAMGYGTMDMLGAFFFSTIAARALAIEEDHQESASFLTKRILTACMIAGFLLALIYIGFMFAAYCHASNLQSIDADQLIHRIASVVLGNYGALFVGVCVTFACLATSVALADVTSTYVYEFVVLKKIPRIICMVIVILMMFCMTQLGFSGIMSFSYPLLKVIYPSLIVLCIVNILHKITDFQAVKIPVLATGIIAAIVNYWH